MSYMPMATALGFIAAINAGDLLIIRALMTPDHVFTDALGHSYNGAATMTAGWQRFLQTYPKYCITVERSFVSEDTVALFGNASGCWRVDGKIIPDRWSVPAAWLAEVASGRIAAWRVFCDTGWVTPPESKPEQMMSGRAPN